MRRTFTEDGGIVRVCRRCEIKKPIEDFSVAQRIDGKPVKWCYECKPCAVAQKQEWRDHVRATKPEHYRKMREKQSAQQRIWRKANPDKARGAVKRYQEKLKTDPTRHTRRLEARRIEHHLRVERKGKTPRHNAVAKSVRDRQPRLPSEPLLFFVEEVIKTRQAFYSVGDPEKPKEHHQDASQKAICAELGISDRDLCRWRTEATTVKFDTAERVLLATDRTWEDVWPRSEYESVYVGLLRDD